LTINSCNEQKGTFKAAITYPEQFLPKPSPMLYFMETPLCFKV